MDEKGYWHNREAESRERIREAFGPETGTVERQRIVFELEVGQLVTIKCGREEIRAVFKGAEKNRVTVIAIAEVGRPLPYLELAQSVELSDGKGKSTLAQIWDNRGGKIILRTLPV